MEKGGKKRVKKGRGGREGRKDRWTDGEGGRREGTSQSGRPLEDARELPHSL